jgi:hypothetical protein
MDYSYSVVFIDALSLYFDKIIAAGADPICHLLAPISIGA